ncbi:MAG: hypothetical protein ACI4S9_03010 [Christensenellales bacterium]
MLNKKEKALMSVIFQKAQKKGMCLLSPLEILENIPYKYEINEAELPQMLKALQIEDYVEIVESYKKNDLVYCITLKTKGMAYLRTQKSDKRTILLKIGLPVIGAVAAFIVGLILKAVF